MAQHVRAHHEKNKMNYFLLQLPTPNQRRVVNANLLCYFLTAVGKLEIPTRVAKYVRANEDQLICSYEIWKRLQRPSNSHSSAAGQLVAVAVAILVFKTRA